MLWCWLGLSIILLLAPQMSSMPKILDHYNHACDVNIDAAILSEYLKKAKSEDLWEYMCRRKWVSWSKFTEAFKYSDAQDLAVGRADSDLTQYFGKYAVEGKWAVRATEYAQVPGNLCVHVVKGYFYRDGVLPCLGSRALTDALVGQQDVSIVTKSQLALSGLVAQHGYRLLSLLPVGKAYQYDNDYYAFTHGLSKLALLYPLFHASTSSKFLVPSGAMASLLGMLGVESSRIVQPPSEQLQTETRQSVFHYTAEATTVLHDHYMNNTNILLPVNALSEIRGSVLRAMQWMAPAAAEKTARPAVVYIQRSLDGEHPVIYRQKRLLAMIKRVLLPQFDLVVLGGAACPGSATADTDWISNAKVLLHAVAVIGVTDKHRIGSCDSDGILAQAAFLADPKKTTFIEILHDSSLDGADAGKGKSSQQESRNDATLCGDVAINNILFAKGRVGGNRHWLLPSKVVGLANIARLSAKVNPKEILQVLAEEGLAAYEHDLFEQLHFNTSAHENIKKTAILKFNNRFTRRNMPYNRVIRRL